MTDATEWLKAPTTDYAEIILATIPIDDKPAEDTYHTLTDPNNYIHALDARTHNA